MCALRLVLAFSFLYFAFCNVDNKKPYVKKSLMCQFSINYRVCIYDRYSLFEEKIVDIYNIDKLSKKQKGDAENLSACANSLREAICSSKPSPLCLEENDDSGAKRVCGQLRRECPLSTNDTVETFEKECMKSIQKLTLSLFTDLTCVYPDKELKGYCPTPTGKMAKILWRIYAKMSESLEMQMGMKFLKNANLLSEDCLKKIKNTMCVPPYCTKDEKSIIVPANIYMQENCNDVLACTNKYEKLSSMLLKPIKDRLNGTCVAYFELYNKFLRDIFDEP